MFESFSFQNLTCISFCNVFYAFDKVFTFSDYVYQSIHYMILFLAFPNILILFIKLGIVHDQAYYTLISTFHTKINMFICLNERSGVMLYYKTVKIVSLSSRESVHVWYRKPMFTEQNHQNSANIFTSKPDLSGI